MKSIKSKIFFFALLSTLVPSLVLGLLSFRQNEELINDNVKRELRILASHASREVDAWINLNVHEANSLTSAKIIIDSLSSAANQQSNQLKNSPEILTQYLVSVQNKLDTILELTVLDTNRHVVASSSSRYVPKEPFQSDWLEKKITHKPVISPPQLHDYFETVTVSIILPVVSYDDYILGQLAITYDLNNVKSVLKSTIKSPRGEILLVDSDGHILLASNSDITHPTVIAPSVFDYLYKHPGEFMTFQNFLKEHVIALAYSAKTLPITVIAEKNHRDVYAAWLEQRNLFIILVGISIFIVAVIAIYLGHSIVIPLHRLIDATGQIVKGNLDIPITDVTQKDEVGKLAHMFNLMTEKLRHSQSRILAANKAMHEKNQLLEKLSITDGLTGLYNRNKLTLIIKEQLHRYQRNKRPFSVLMIDVDFFKELNDKLGHVAGDEILAAVARNLSQSIRNIDFAARYGGDEFIIILTETNVREASITAERIRSRTSEIKCKSTDTNIKVTLSIGIIQSEPDDKSPTTIISRADHALYKAKHAGRNQAYAVQPVSVLIS